MRRKSRITTITPTLVPTFGSKVGREFFQRDPLTCARELIGCELVWDDCGGMVVEAEAYAAVNDEACHTFTRPSARAFIANHQAGTAYVYLSYGMYWLFNVLVKGGSEDGFVLVRALQPTCGLDRMRIRRFPPALSNSGAPPDASIERPRPVAGLCSGPGKLTIALGIQGGDHGVDLCARSGRGFRAPLDHAGLEVAADIRIGISKAAHLPWRFLVANNPFVSIPVKAQPALSATRRQTRKPQPCAKL